MHSKYKGGLSSLAMTVYIERELSITLANVGIDNFTFRHSRSLFFRKGLTKTYKFVSYFTNITIINFPMCSPDSVFIESI